jgi:hypothetical protein
MNTVRGAGLTLALAYGAWIKSGRGDEPTSLDDIPELREVLELELDPVYDPSPTVRQALGQYFRRLWYLDADWARRSIPRIFPVSGAEAILGDAAWWALVTFNHAYVEIFVLARAQYERALAQVSGRQTTQATHAEYQLAQHVMELQLRSDEAESLQRALFTSPRVDLRVYALEFVGILMRGGGLPDDDAIREKLMRLWEDREHANAAGSADLAELTTFGAWFASSYFPIAWVMEHLMLVIDRGVVLERPFEVVEALARVPNEYLMAAIVCLREIAEADREGWGLLGWREAGHQLLARGVSSSDVGTREAARGLVSRLMLRGHETAYRDLVR